MLNIAEQIVSSVWNYFGFLQVDAVTSLNSRYIKYVPVKNKRVVYNTVYKEQGDIVSPQKPYVLWVANLKSTKRPEAFIDLAKRMKDSDLHFIMIGRMDITYQRYVENAERELANFKYIGGASPLEVNALLKTALCLVHTCKPEGFGNIFIQSWFQGCPTISYTFDPDNFIQLHGLGFVSGNLGRLAKDIKKIKNNPVLRQKLSDNSIHTATKFFDQNRLGNQLEDLFQELCLPKDQNKHMT